MATTKDTGVTVDAANVINDILPFCAQGVDGRDLLAQADYAADVQRTIGHQPGIARQELANKQARQVSHMAAGLAQFLARRYTAGVKDDGNLDKVEAAIVAAIYAVIGPNLPGIATTLVNGISHPDGVTLKIDAAGKLSVVATSKYEVGEFYYFRHPALKSGMQPAQGGLISNAATQYPQIWAYLQTTDGQLLCKTEAQWQAMTTATWATLADGTTVGWGGIGGAPFYVQDLAAGTLRMPDLRGMYAEAAGFDSLGVGDSRGDQGRRAYGEYGCRKSPMGGAFENADAGYTTGVFGVGSDAVTAYVYNAASGTSRRLILDTGRTMPVGAAFAPRRWGALACAYLGTPVVS